MNEGQDTNQLVQDLLKRVQALESEAPTNQLTLGLISGDLERTMAAFMIALSATTFDMEVDLFFMFRATAALRDPKKARKAIADELAPSPIQFDLKKHGAKSLEELIAVAGELGVRITVCNLSLDLMDIKPDELIDYPHLKFAGLTTFVDQCSRSKQCWFM